MRFGVWLMLLRGDLKCCCAKLTNPISKGRPHERCNRSCGPNLNGSFGDHVMANQALPSPEVLRQLLRYEPDSAKLFWLPRSLAICKDDRYRRAWNSRNANKEAFTSINSDGYKSGSIFGISCKAHRVIWAISHSYWPDVIDHIDGDTLNNRLDNLRSVTQHDNCRNTARHKNNNTGVSGVSWHSRNETWCVYVTINKKRKHIGSFNLFELACEARRSAEVKSGFHPNHGRSRRVEVEKQDVVEGK